MPLTDLDCNELDSFDLKILDTLSKDGRVTTTALAEQVGLSKTPCHARVRRLETEGYILGYSARLNPVKLGLEHVAFVEVKLSNTTAKALLAFNTAVSQLTQVEQCHMIAGGFDYLLKVRTASISDYRRFLGAELSSLPHIAHSSTFVAMESVKEAAVLGSDT